MDNFKSSYIKIKYFAKKKKIMRVEKQTTTWEEVFAAHISTKTSIYIKNTIE